MNREFWLGLVLTIIGIAAYIQGLRVAYPGRALSVTAVMVGIALVAIRSFDPDEAMRET
jgi:hypothetical protein